MRWIHPQWKDITSLIDSEPFERVPNQFGAAIFRNVFQLHFDKNRNVKDKFSLKYSNEIFSKNWYSLYFTFNFILQSERWYFFSRVTDILFYLWNFCLNNNYNFDFGSMGDWEWCETLGFITITALASTTGGHGLSGVANNSERH